MCSLLSTLTHDFGLCVNPGEILARENKGLTTESTFSGHVTLVGGSNLKALAPLLEASGLKINDLTVGGWLPTETNIDQVVREIQKLGDTSNMVFILDLLSNAAHRYTLFDGTGNLSVKIGNWYHMPGKVMVTTGGPLDTMLGAVSEILKSAENAIKIVIPPLPRYVGIPCCFDPSHCTDFEAESTKVGLMESLHTVRNQIKSSLGKKNLKNVWVLDTVGSVAGFPPLPPDYDSKNRAIRSLPTL